MLNCLEIYMNIIREREKKTEMNKVVVEVSSFYYYYYYYYFINIKLLIAFKLDEKKNIYRK